ncbi:hypothetical protein AQUCO_02600108v1 [Aquilegia coerulea]|uniref:U3 small nucleolar RNA-associated protein 15 C-terminal domain-containing protein n=1 Tax=Aquilegia coerulea TaxID=218851 RepID=A0A2G5D883_AQUCA|nr:hypothetical protein AQUCO_02600108v1 [Aquilegia coerulea]
MAENQIGKTFPVKSRLKPTSKKTSSSPESRYWRTFKTTEIPKLIYPITSIDFSPISPYDFASTYSASVTLYNSQTFEPKSTFSSFKDIAYSACFRCDGKLLAAGGETGLVQVFDIKTRSALRRLHGHNRPVRVVKYPGLDKLHLFSGGDDSLVKFWDIATETQLLNFQGHKDYVRSGSASPASSDLFATGSYDHTVKVWDSRGGASMKYVMEFNHGKPVEDVVFLPSGGLIATAGGNYVKIWDVIGGGKLVYTMESHNKTVTKMCVGKVKRDGSENSDQYRLFSVALDGYMKVFDYSALKLTHSMRFPAPLLSIGFSPDFSTRVIGTSNGIMYAGKKKKKVVDVDAVVGVGDLVGFTSVPEPEKRVLRPSNFRYFRRGQSEKPSMLDHVIERPRKPKLAMHDKLLKSFRHKEALVTALTAGNPKYIMAVMEELVARRKLLKCVSNLGKDELELLLKFLHKYTTMPSYSGFLIGFTKKVLQMRAEDVNASDILQGHVRHLKRSVEEEINIQQSLQEIQGIISPLLRIAGRR